MRRYEREKPTEIIHIEKLGRFDGTSHRIVDDRTGQSNGRGIGWGILARCIDDHSRVAFSQILRDGKTESAARVDARNYRFFQTGRCPSRKRNAAPGTAVPIHAMHVGSVYDSRP